MPGETMMILFRRMLSQRNLIYANVFVSASSHRNKNQFFHYFGLLHDLLHRQDLPNKWFDRRLKRVAIVLSIFWKIYLTRLVLLFEFSRYFLIWLMLTVLWVESCVRRFLSALFFLKIQNHIYQKLQPALHIQESLRGL